MPKRNFILLIVFLVLIVIITLLFLYSRNRTPEDGGDSRGVVDFIADFNPFSRGRNTSTNEPTGDGQFQETPDPRAQAELKLEKVSSMPIAGYTIFLKERFVDVPLVEGEAETTPSAPATEFISALRYVEKATGSIYQTPIDIIDERKLSDTVVPRVHEAYFAGGGESVIMRYLKPDEITISTFVGSLPKDVLGGDTSPGKLTGVFLPENVIDLSVSPDASKMFYLYNIGETVAGITANSLGNARVQIFDSPFTEWLTGWPNTTMVTLTTKPSVAVPGYMYAVEPNKKDFRKIIGGINGLTTLTSPDGKLVLYSNGSLTTSIYNIATGENRTLKIRTLPEKCTWAKDNTSLYCAVPKFASITSYPDAWYQGVVSFSDQIWKINLFNGAETAILDPTSVSGGEVMDGIKLTLDKNEDYLFLVNKKDSFLWELKLK